MPFTEQSFFVTDCKLTHICLWVQIKQTSISVIVVIVVVVVVVVGAVYDRLWLQIKQTSIGVVHANCFRFLAWPIVPPSFLDVFYRKYASAAIWLLKPKYATLNLSFGLGRERSIGCLCISKKNKRNTSCAMRRILISLEFITSLIFITVLGIVAVWLSVRIYLCALPPTNIAWFYFSFLFFLLLLIKHPFFSARVICRDCKIHVEYFSCVSSFCSYWKTSHCKDYI